MFVTQCSIHRSRANYIWEKKNKLTTSSSLQACFLVAHSTGDLMRINFIIAYIQFKVDRPQTTVVAKNLSVLQLFISRMPKCVQFYNWFRLH